MKHCSSRRSAAITAVGILLATAALSACSSGSKSGAGAAASGTTGSTGSTADPTLLGPDNKATGAPVKIGFGYDGRGPASDTSDQLPAAKAVAAYANDKLGGIGGHRIEVVGCETKGDPSTSCGNEFVTDKVLAVVGAQLSATDPVIKPINEAGIPYIDEENAGTQLLSKSFNFVVANALAPVAGPAIYAHKNGIKSVAIVIIDVAGVVDSITSFATLIFGKLGIKVTVTGVPVGTADMTPQIQAAAGKNPEMFHILGDPTFCASAIKAIRTLGLKQKITGIDRCLSKTAAASVPGGFAGITVFSAVSLDPADPETKLFDAVRKVYMKGTPSTSNISTAYQAMLGFVRGVNAAKITDVTSAGIIAALKAMPPTPLPLGGGATFQCNGKAVSLAPPVCATAGISSVATADGGQEHFAVYDDPSLFVNG